jgi:hypothetical protein
MTLAVTDVRSGADPQINEAAKALGQSSQRRAVFRQIHSGRKRTKTVQEIADAIPLPRKRVLEEAVKLVHKQIIQKTSQDGETAYVRDNFYYVHREEILRRASRLTPTARPARATSPSSPRSAERQIPTSAKLRRVRKSPKTASSPFDLFLSHASEDKAAIARPLFKALKRAGLRVWFDEAELTMGDSLRRKIDEGLARCRFGVVILSRKFFAKDWPQRELDGLVARESASRRKAILPVWHKLTKAQVAEYSPTLADRLAAKSQDGIESLVTQIQAALARR